ncbi:glutamate receptor ionotropic, NMDA 2A [Hydra vulgaris]|uniref:glutamate receptor ionotropic, NMDA 2A n=1 Tax=Hydra vulgaris TaxID=6087 RepID=UPI001F5EC99C|nr:glutamate receptor ionotropic, NMDA 2A [Hydra vulgaris]
MGDIAKVYVHLCLSTVISCRYLFISDEVCLKTYTERNENLSRFEILKITNKTTVDSLAAFFKNYGDNITAVFSFTEHAQLIKSIHFPNYERYYSFGSNRAHSEALQRNLPSGVCFRFNQLYKEILTVFVKSLWIKNNAAIIENSYCSKIFLHTILKDLETSNNSNIALSWTLIAIDFRKDNNTIIFEKLYPLRTILVNIVVVLTPIEHFSKITSHLNLINSPSIWLIPDYEKNVTLFQNFQKVIYFDISDNFELLFYSQTNLSLHSLLNTYEESLNNSNDKLGYCLECRLAETVITQMEKSQRKRYSLKIYQISKSATGSLIYANSSAEINLGHLSISDQNGLSAFRFLPDELFQEKLRVVTLIEPPFTFMLDTKKDINDETCNGIICRIFEKEKSEWKQVCCLGYGISLLLSIMNYINVDVDLYVVKDSKYGELVKGEWNGLIGELVRDNADMALAILTVTEERSKFIDFTIPFMEQYTGIITKPEALQLSFFNWEFMEPLSGTIQLIVWFLVIGMIVINYLFENIIYIASLQDQKFAPEVYYTLNDSMIYIAGVTLQKDMDPVNPVKAGARLTALIYTFGMVILVSTYTAKLAEYNIQTQEKNPFLGSKDERIRNPTPSFKFATAKSTSFVSFFRSSDIPEYQRIGKFMDAYNVNTLKEGVDRVKNGSLDAFINDYIFMFWYASNDHDCQLRLFKDQIAKSINSFALKKNSPHLEEINNAIQRLIDEEKIIDMQNKWMSKFCQPVFFVQTKTPLGIKNFGGLIMVLVVTMVLCFPLLVSETFYYKYHIHQTLATLFKTKFGRTNNETVEEMCGEQLNSSVVVNRLGVVTFKNAKISRS